MGSLSLPALWGDPETQLGFHKVMLTYVLKDSHDERSDIFNCYHSKISAYYLEPKAHSTWVRRI
jgi:hypothetical protein